MPRLGALIRKEFLLLAHDRHGLAVLFLMPAVFILIMSLALRDAMDADAPGRVDYRLLAPGDGYAERALAQELADLLGPASTDADAILIDVPPGLADRIGERLAGSSTLLLSIRFDASVAAADRLLVEGRARGALARVIAEFLMEDELGLSYEEARRLREAVDAERLPVRVTSAAGRAVPNAVQQSVPAWLVFAMFFVVLPIATGVLTERENGTLERLRLMNLPPYLLLLARVPAYYLVNLCQLGLMLAVGVWLVPAIGGDGLDLGRSPAGLWLVGSALSLAAIGLAQLIAVLARTAVQATVVGGVINLILGAVGGVMVPKSVMPPAMQVASQASPMSWALEGMWDTLVRGGGLRDTLPEAAALTAFGLACLALAAFVLSRRTA